MVDNLIMIHKIHHSLIKAIKAIESNILYANSKTVKFKPK